MYEEIDFKKIIAVSNRHVSRLPYLAQGFPFAGKGSAGRGLS